MEETMESSRVRLRLKIVILSVFCGLCFAFFIGISLFSIIAEKDWIEGLVFAGLGFVFLFFWIIGIIRLKKRHRK